LQEKTTKPISGSQRPDPRGGYTSGILESGADQICGLSFRIPAEDVGQHLDGDLAVQFRVFGAVHDPHATCAELFDDPVARDGVAYHGESFHWRFAHCNQKDVNLLSL